MTRPDPVESVPGWAVQLLEGQGALTTQMKAVQIELAEVKLEVKKTNGNVRGLLAWKLTVDDTLKAFGAWKKSLINRRHWDQAYEAGMRATWQREARGAVAALTLAAAAVAVLHYFGIDLQ